MKMKTFLTTFLISLSFWTVAQEKCTLTVEVTSIKKYEGKIAISIYDETKKFLSEDVVQATRKDLLNSEKVIFKFNELPKGKYAVAVYHDKNSNLELDTNLVGIPTEPYGFSNNPSTMFGPPSFEKASFLVDSPAKHIEISL